MFQFRLAHIGLVLAATGFTLAPSLVGIAPVAYAAESLRPDVAKPLREAGDLIKKQKYKEALAKVRDADAVSGKNGYESFVIDQMRASIASALRDNDLALRSYESMLGSGRLSGAEQLKYIEAIIGIYYNTRNFPKVISWGNRYQKEGGGNPQIRNLLTQAYLQTGDCAQASKDALAEIRSAEKANRSPAEGNLQLVASCAYKQVEKNADKTEYVNALEKLVTYYPKKDQWTDLLNRLQNKSGYSSRQNLNLFRLKHALGQIQTVPLYMELTQLALLDGYAVEGKQYIEHGFTSNIMGAGADAERQKRLRNLAATKATELERDIAKLEAEAVKNKDAKAVSNVGYNYVTLGKKEKGLALMEQAITLPGAKYPEDLKLNLGLAYHLAGQTPKALQTLKTVQGNDGSADLARYWSIQIKRPLK